MKQQINMIGGGFQHDVCSSAGSIPRSIEWIKGNHTAPISIHIDHAIFNIPTDKSKKNYAWLAEARTINLGVYDWCRNNVEYLENNFEMIFTHDKSLLPLSNKFKLVICNVIPWVKDCKIHEKTKLVSMIASSKVMCQEHVYRQQLIQKFYGKLDHFGRGFRVIEKKEEGLNDYCFSLTVENGNYPNMFTEKITDCFATGTIPVYWGCPTIGEFFNTDGIISLDDNFKIEDLSFDLYRSKLKAVEENYKITMELPTAEDYIYENYIK